MAATAQPAQQREVIGTHSFASRFRHGLWPCVLNVGDGQQAEGVGALNEDNAIVLMYWDEAKSEMVVAATIPIGPISDWHVQTGYVAASQTLWYWDGLHSLHLMSLANVADVRTMGESLPCWEHWVPKSERACAWMLQHDQVVQHCAVSEKYVCLMSTKPRQPMAIISLDGPGFDTKMIHDSPDWQLVKDMSFNPTHPQLIVFSGLCSFTPTILEIKEEEGEGCLMIETKLRLSFSEEMCILGLQWSPCGRYLVGVGVDNQEWKHRYLIHYDLKANNMVMEEWKGSLPARISEFSLYVRWLGNDVIILSTYGNLAVVQPSTLQTSTLSTLPCPTQHYFVIGTATTSHHMYYIGNDRDVNVARI